MIAIRAVLMAHMVLYPVSVRRCDECSEREQRDQKLVHDFSPLEL